MRDLLDEEPQQPNPDDDNRIPYFDAPEGEELSNESASDGDR